MPQDESLTPIQRACDIVGGQSALARMLIKPNGQALTPQAVGAMVKNNRVDPRWVLTIEEATGGQVTRRELRPDLYPDAAAA